MAYGVGATEEARKMAVKPTVQKDLKGKEVAEKRDTCYFCGSEIPKEFAYLTKQSLDEYVCGVCLTKLVKLMAKQGVSRLE